MVDWKELTRIIMDLDAAGAAKDPEVHKLILRSLWLFARYREDF